MEWDSGVYNHKEKAGWSGPHLIYLYTNAHSAENKHLYADTEQWYKWKFRDTLRQHKPECCDGWIEGLQEGQSGKMYSVQKSDSNAEPYYGMGDMTVSTQ